MTNPLKLKVSQGISMYFSNLFLQVYKSQLFVPINILIVEMYQI
jgi:hypothetical protein